MSQHADNDEHNVERDSERKTEELFARIPVPPPASAEVAGDIRRCVLDEFDRISSLPAVDTRWRRAIHTGVTIMSHPASRTIFAVAAAVFLALWLGMPRRSTAFADFMTPIVDAKSAKFKMAVKTDVQPKPIEMTAYYRAPHWFRQEFQGTVNIADFDRGQMLSLDAAHKRATILKIKDFDELKKKNGNSTNNLFRNLQTVLAEYRAHQKGHLEELGEKEVDGKRLFGFRLTAPTMTQTIWADKATGNVERIEATIPGPPKSETMFSDFVFDVPLEASLFSVDPPADYKVISLDLDASPATEQEFIAALGPLCDAMDGEFPGSLDTAGFGMALAKVLMSKATGDETNKEQMKEAFKIGKGMNFAVTLPAEANAHYAGKGVKRQGPKAPVFWYKPAGSQNYRVIYSDLSTGAAEAPPEVPGAVPVGQQPAKAPQAN
jgi:outer membrane lipoprotein-sorting protein